MSCRAFSPERSRTGPNGSRDIFIHICIIDFSIRYAQSQSACRLSDSERNDNEVLFSQPLTIVVYNQLEADCDSDEVFSLEGCATDKATVDVRACKKFLGI